MQIKLLFHKTLSVHSQEFLTMMMLLMGQYDKDGSVIFIHDERGVWLVYTVREPNPIWNDVLIGNLDMWKYAHGWIVDWEIETPRLKSKRG